MILLYWSPRIIFGRGKNYSKAAANVVYAHDNSKQVMERYNSSGAQNANAVPATVKSRSYEPVGTGQKTPDLRKLVAIG